MAHVVNACEKGVANAKMFMIDASGGDPDRQRRMKGGILKKGLHVHIGLKLASAVATRCTYMGVRDKRRKTL